ncbi:MAG: nucleotide-binding protein [Burkholderiales bacterium]
MPSGAASLSGKVLEVRDADSFTYLRLRTKDGEIWAAVTRTPVKNGAEVTLENTIVMNGLESKALKKKFDRVMFGTLAGASSGTSGELAAVHAGIAKTADAEDIKVPKANGPNARTVAEINAKRVELKDKTVLLRGKVVRYTPDVLGKNWLHLRDGSGSAADQTNDVVATTKDRSRIGDVVLVKGIVRTDRDLGAGYAYRVLIEEAALQK